MNLEMQAEHIVASMVYNKPHPAIKTDAEDFAYFEACNKMSSFAG